MIERRGCSCLLNEATAGLIVCGETLGQQLQRDLASEPDVFGEIDLAHAARADLRNNAIVRQGLADHSALGLYHLLRTIGSERASGSKVYARGVMISALWPPTWLRRSLRWKPKRRPISF